MFKMNIFFKNDNIIFIPKLLRNNPAVVADWAKASILIQVEWHQQFQFQILLEVRFIRSKISSIY